MSTADGYFVAHDSVEAGNGAPSQILVASPPPSPSVEASGSVTGHLDVHPTTRGPSRQSQISGTTLNPEDGAESSAPPTFLGGPVVAADPLPITGDPIPETAQGGGSPAVPDTTKPARREVDRSICPMPVSFFVRRRYKERFYLSTDPSVQNKELKEIEKIPAKNALPRRYCISCILITVFPDLLICRRVSEIEGWKKHVHPEGQVYFRYAVEDRAYHTNAWLFDSDTLEDIKEAVKYIERELKGPEHSDLKNKAFDIGLDVYIDPDSGNKLPCYYMCDPEEEEIFWLQECHIDWVVEEENFPSYDREHLKHALSQAYWFHVHMFPHEKPLSQQSLQELISILNYHLYDRETSRTSNAPYGADDLHRFVELFSRIKPRSGDVVSEYDMAAVARMKTLLCGDQFRHYHGTKWARLDSNRSVHHDTSLIVHNHTWWFYVTSWLLFWTPSIYIKRIDEMWLDQKINHQPWRKFISELQEDWTASITPSTVILGANVGFLAIQSVDQGGNMVPHRSAGQIISYISTLLTIGNIIACTVLARQHRPSRHRHAEDALNYLLSRASEKWQAELLAIVLSIPTAFFVWGLLAFSAAILWDCFDATTISTRAAVGAASLFTALLIILVVMNGKQLKQPTFFHSIPTQMKQRLKTFPIRKFTVPLRRLTTRFGTGTAAAAATNEGHSVPMTEVPTRGPHSV
ncbi:hypothetical protein FKP32DRAFT_1684141 [Trametes sanguinea]|nr:hypothetical protein FKP32DRAFT_1684141 [Trametes sanguinea]